MTTLKYLVGLAKSLVILTIAVASLALGESLLTR